MGETINVNARLTTAQAAAYAGVTRKAILNWHNRGYGPASDRRHLERGPDGKYRLLDVAKAEHATRRRARR